MKTKYMKAPVENQPEVRDYFPMLFYSNEEVVEIKMVEAIFRDNAWEFVDRGVVLENTGRRVITKVVYEGPEGCYETHLAGGAGAVSIEKGTGGSPWYPCR